MEDCPYRDDFFDLAIMINVLDHVQDARKCMENLTRIVKPGGWLVLGQDLTNEEDLGALSEDKGLVGHPIKMPYEWFSPYLDIRFKSFLHKVLTREQGREPRHHYGTLIYAGRKY